MPQDEAYIEGVFNYCDRWCERCQFTLRCRNFAMQEEAFPDDESRDMNNEAFWEALKGVFARTMEMIREGAREHGVDLEAIQREAAESRDDDRWEESLDHPLFLQGSDYGRMVNEWFEREGSRFEDKDDELNQQLRLGLKTLDPEAEAIRISDAVDVIRWYQHQIAVKLQRALSKDLEIDGTLGETAQYDANGSAKVALIGIDRSLAAWAVLREAFPETGDTILDLMVHLDRLHRTTEQAFCDAPAFRRPGFDV